MKPGLSDWIFDRHYKEFDMITTTKPVSEALMSTYVCMDVIGFLLQHVELDPKDIGVVTPYSAQARVIQEELHHIGLGDMSVGIVDLYQGADRKVVVYVMVVTREDGAGFAAKCERHVVATTRAIDLLVVIRDKNLCESDHTLPPHRSALVHSRRSSAS
ncbi:uncharacterized protein PG986_004823 [Apiospora aurea]|uniref:DNA2/NAM7 helicase-like C-terminal domain-containing protein n=1 Tax=Apiospora aurea TaxID=335848 RepID=A0ABR1QNQ3_9PEZI